MLLPPEGSTPATQERRCVACPLRKKRMCACWPGLELAADESVILTYHKLLDSVADRGFFRGLPARFLSLLLRPAYRTAAQYRPEFDGRVTECLAQLQQLEADQSGSIDRTADTFARILEAAAPCDSDTRQERTLAQLLYHVGRWIYLVDARDDLREDKQRGQYNPLSLRFSGGEPDDEYLHTTLQHSLNLAAAAYSLLPAGPWHSVVGNILYLGLPAVEQAVFAGDWNKRKKNNIGRNNT